MSLPTSLCVIARNEQATLPVCLRSVAGLFPDIVLVDTGSADRTKEIAAQFWPRVFDFPWCDDFAAARNESLRHAIGDWAFWLDADEHLDDANRAKLGDLLASLKDENAAFEKAVSVHYLLDRGLPVGCSMRHAASTPPRRRRP